MGGIFAWKPAEGNYISIIIGKENRIFCLNFKIIVFDEYLENGVWINGRFGFITGKRLKIAIAKIAERRMFMCGIGLSKICEVCVTKLTHFLV
ncbi:MAG: hypothetical protein IPH31_10775 [Lewinellaceae bacterium]|nr:hypothetical protein [Lewinellaceae bacterium]